MTAPTLDPPPLPSQFALGGILYEPVVHSTFRHDGYLTDIVERGALGGLVDRAQRGEDFPAAALAAMGELYRRGVLFDLLGGLVTEVGTPWSPAGAQRNADRFAELTDPEEKGILARILMETLAGFFGSGVTSNATSDPSSPANAGAPASALPSSDTRPDSADSPATGDGTA